MVSQFVQLKNAFLFLSWSNFSVVRRKLFFLILSFRKFSNTYAHCHFYFFFLEFHFQLFQLNTAQLMFKRRCGIQVALNFHFSNLPFFFVSLWITAFREDGNRLLVRDCTGLPCLCHALLQVCDISIFFLFFNFFSRTSPFALRNMLK